MALLRKEDLTARVVPDAPELGAILGRNSRFEGKLSFEGTVRIDGTFVGDAASEGHLIVGAGATVEGDIRVGSAEVSGEVKGTLSTTGLLELRDTARVVGDLCVGALRVDQGACFEGNVKMTPGA